jgi:hypothetical protein
VQPLAAWVYRVILSALVALSRDVGRVAHVPGGMHRCV